MEKMANKFISACVAAVLLCGCVKTGGAHSAAGPTELPFIDTGIKEGVIFDNGEIEIKTVSLDMNAESGPALVFAGSNSSDVDRCVTLKNCSVNNIMIEPGFEMQLDAMSKASATAVFPENFLMTANIEAFSSISFIVRIARASDRADFFETEQINMLTSMSGNYTQAHEFRGTLIAYANGIKMMIGRMPDLTAPLGKQIYIYIDNTLSEDIRVETAGVRVNGIEMEPMFIYTVCAGKKAWAPLTFRDSELVEKGISSVDELAFSLIATSVFGVVLNTEEKMIRFGPDKPEE